MNHIYKLVWNRARNMYMAVSETAKSHGKSGSISRTGRKTAAILLAVLALTAGAGTVNLAAATDNTLGSGNGVAVGTGSSAPKAENVAIGKGATISYSGGVGQPSTGDIVIGGGAHINNYIDQGGGIAIGANSFVENMTGGLERSFDFNQAGYKTIPFFDVPYGNPNDPTKMVTGVAIGQNTYARSGSIMLGTHNYKGDLGDVTVDSAHTKDQNMLLFSTTLGANSYSNGLFSSVTGAYSIASSDYSGGEHASKNFGATITGSLNSIESATSSNEYSGVANSIVGLANRTSNSNGSLIFGAGNEIKNSITNISAPTSGGNSSKALQDSLMNAVKKGKSGGATLVIGGGNTADYTQKTQILGVKNTVTGTENNISMYNMIDGFNNTVNGASHLYTIGTNNTITNAKNTILFGDNRKAEGVENSVIIGNADEKTPITTEKKDTVILGHNANATIDGGVAIGSGSIANVDKGQKGYYVKHDQRSEEGQGYPFQKNDSAWISRAGAVSVGDTTNKDQSKWITRQITGVAAGTNDTDAVNVAQLKNSQTKYFSIYDPGDNWLGIFPQIPDWAEKYKNENNQGATNYWGMAAGFGTSTDGLASTVIGSLSRTNSLDGMQGATSVSVGTFNFNLSDPITVDVNSDNPDDQAQTVLGAANSIVGQVNLAKNSNGALIYGAGNVVTNSYRNVDGDGGASGINGLLYGDGDMQSLLSDPEKAIKVVGKLIDSSGGKAMVFGGGNVLDKAYSTQVVGVGNTVTGSDLNFTYQESPEIGKIKDWVEQDAARTADIWNQYEASLRNNGTRLNYVDGYYSTLKNGQNDYMIGTANEVTGDDASKNKSNIVFGDYHKLKNGQNNIIIGSADGSVEEKATPFVDTDEYGKHITTEITGQKQHVENLTDAVIIGHNADVQKNGGVALGSNSVAATDEGVVGLDLNGKDHSSDTTGTWKSTAAAVSVGDSTGDKKITRQITNVAAGTEDTDAVNVAQLKKAQTHFFSVKSTDSTKGNYNNDGAKGANSLAAGVNALANGQNSVAVGYKATAQNDAIAIGDSAKAGNNGIAVGMNATAGYGQNMALGYHASVANGVRNSTALGYGSQVTQRDILSSDGSDGVISVGKAVGQSGEKGLTRRIINVRAGVNDTDAVNVSQLKTAASEVKGGTNIASVTTENAADGHTIYTVNAKGAEVKGDSNFTVTPSTDEKTNITTYGLALNDTITIGKGKDAKPITIDGTKGEITGLTNRDTKAADFAKAGRAATEEQLDAMHNAITGEDRYVQSGTIDTTSGTMKLTVANGKTVDITGLTDYQLDTDGTKTKYDASAHKLTLSMKDTLNTGNPAKSVEFDGIANTADVAKAKTEIKGGTNIASLGTETAADGHTIYTVNAKGTEVTGDDNFTVTPSTDEKTNITTYGLALNDTITIGKGKDANPITIDRTKGEISGLTNITWHKDVDYSKSTKAATEAQIQSAVNAAKEDVKASDVDTHVAKGSYAVDTITTADGQKTQGVSLDIVDKDGKPTGNKVEITDVAKASDIGDISKLSDGVKNADGKKTTVVDAINNVNTKVDKVDKKVGDLDYSSTNYVAKNDSATTAIGKLDAAIKDASSVANNITGGSNIDVTETNDKNGKVTGHQVALKNDISLNSVTAKTVKADEVNTGKLTVSDSAAIGNVSINKDGKGTVNGLTNTTWNADKITSGQAATEDQLKAATKNAVNYDGDDSKTVTLRQDTTIKNVADTSIEKGSRNAVNAGTVYNETRVANDGHYIKAANTAGANITALDNQVAANAGNIFNLDNRVGELGSRINKVGAGAAALAALHPLDYDPQDKWDFAAGVGNYRNATAAAVGLFYRPNERTMFNLGWTMGDNRNMVNGGFSLKFGKSNKYIKYSKTEMAAVIDNQSREIAELKAKDAQNAKDNAEMKAEIEALKKQVEALAARK